MKPLHRRIGGIVLALLMIPVLAGLLACMPVPIGDPERSRVDPGMTGVWFMILEDDFTFVTIAPYDKRTWAVRMLELDADIETGDGEPGYEDMLAALDDADPDYDDVTYYKVWRTRLRGKWFMTWEPLGLSGIEPEDDMFWHVFRIENQNKDRFELRMLNPDYDGFDEVQDTRRAYESVIKRNIDDPELYEDSYDSAVYVFTRINPDDLQE